MKTIRPEGLDEFVSFGARQLRCCAKHFMDCYLTRRFHQGIGSRVIQPSPSSRNDNGNLGPIRCRSRLGGLLGFYHWEAA